MNKQQFSKQAISFLELLFEDMQRNSIELMPHWDIDHICYRTHSDHNYLQVKEAFKQFSRVLVESEVNGRLITTFKLKEPIYFNEWQIDLVELPAPKIGKVTKEGYEHIEIVCDCPFREIKEKYSHCEYDEKGLTKDFNKELEIVLGDRNIKFHHSSLESVINMETNELVWNSLNELKILNVLKVYNPLIAGTFPLAIN